MTAPEVMNSSPTVDAVMDPSRPVHNQSLQMVVEQAHDQLRQLTLQRREIAHKITMIKRTIHGLTLLDAVESQLSPDDDGAIAQRRRGKTRACRIVLS